MLSVTEPGGAQASERSRLPAAFETWNRKLHFYTGLFLMFFVWLFALTGLLLNHPAWTFHEHWKNRRETVYESKIRAPSSATVGDLAQARDIMRQLDIHGEILWTTTRTNPTQLEFQVRRPGWFFFINADWGQRHASVRRSEVNVWGLTKALHTFSGNVADDPRNQRDWTLTAVWAYSMDAVAAGLIFMVVSSYYLWLRLPRKRVPGFIALSLGVITCGFFCIGLRWMF